MSARDSFRWGRVYLSGPMTGYPDDNRPAFRAVAARWRALGYEVLNPAETAPELRRQTYLRLDLLMALAADELVLLSGWEQSNGARLEVAVAQALGIPIRDAMTLALIVPEAVL